MFKMVQKMQNSGLEMVAGLTRPLMYANNLFILTVVFPKCVMCYPFFSPNFACFCTPK